MASHFLGAAKHITLLESDGVLVGPYNENLSADKENQTQRKRKMKKLE